MGRSRGNFHSNDEDPTQRSRRKKNVSNENSESAAAGQGPGEGKKALYHCNYCNKDITGRIRIKCVVCPDFDLCIECFSVGAEVTPHKSNHHYRVMDNLAFPLICPDWNADDEILLLEGIEMYGFWNWAEVAEHVGTKTREQCIDHYTNVYLNSPYFPLPFVKLFPNRTCLMLLGKIERSFWLWLRDRCAIAKSFYIELVVAVLGSCVLGEVKEESPFSPSRVKIEDTHKGGSAGGPNANAHKGKGSKGKKPKSSGTEGPSLLELSGFNIKRQEFDPEYDNDAEQLLAEMEFKDNDNDDERELKLRVLRIYSKRLDERKRRKDFILERNLLYPNPFEENFSAEERALCRKYDIFMRFHTKEEHEQLLDSVIQEYRGLKRIQELKEAQAAGCRTSAEAERYWEIKRRQEAQDASRKKRESSQVGLNAFAGSEFAEKDSNLRPGGQPSSSHVHGFDIMGFNETQLLSEAEKRLCCELRLTPPVYLKMQEVISVEVFSGNIQKKSDVHHLFNLDPSKVDRVYDVLVKKGLAPP